VEVLRTTWDQDPRGLRQRIGIQLQETQFSDKLKVREIVRLFRSFYREGRDVDEVLSLVELEAKAETWYVKLSGGQKQRLAVACALVGRPQLLFLDEPTTGLDPRSRHIMWQLVRDLVADGVTVLLTTQYLEEADQLADRVAVLDRGRIVAEGTPGELKRRVPGAHIRLHFADAGSLDAAARILREGTRDDEQLALRIPHEGGVRALRQVLARLDGPADGAGIAVDDLSIHTPDLDDVFFALTGHPTKEL